MKKLLIITREQFGYLTDTYNYCKHLKDKFDITYICFNQNKEKISCENINIIYIEEKNNVNLSSYNFLKRTVEHIRVNHNKYDSIFCVFFRFCFLIPILTRNENIILDIRTGNVNNNKYKNLIGNIEIKFNSLFFKKISIICESLAKKLNIKKYEILPLGANKFIKKDFIDNEMNLIYIGTFNNRNIHETIHAYGKYLKERKEKVPTKYTIIGDGADKEIELIKDTIEELNISKYVELMGRVSNDNLGEFMKTHNIGISYVPITKYYNVQPPTKTYEYIMNGLVCIATETDENKKIINKKNGVLCKDNLNSLSEALHVVQKNLEIYDCKELSFTVYENTWENISKSIFLKIIKQ